jgi:hypothetical protein
MPGITELLWAMADADWEQSSQMSRVDQRMDERVPQYARLDIGMLKVLSAMISSIGHQAHTSHELPPDHLVGTGQASLDITKSADYPRLSYGNQLVRIFAYERHSGPHVELPIIHSFQKWQSRDSDVNRTISEAWIAKPHKGRGGFTAGSNERTRSGITVRIGNRNSPVRPDYPMRSSPKWRLQCSDHPRTYHYAKSPILTIHNMYRAHHDSKGIDGDSDPLLNLVPIGHDAVLAHCP